MFAFTLISVLLCLASLFGYINHKLLRLPRSVALLLVGLVASLAILALDALRPEIGLRAWSEHIVGTRQLPRALLDGALSFLLFGGALNLSIEPLWQRKLTVLLLATIGVLLAAGLLGLGMFQIFNWLGDPLPLTACVVLGAILAPTDPVAIAGLLRRLELPDTLTAVMAGESLFNDGVAVVLFSLALHAAMGGAAPRPGAIGIDFAREALGGGALGAATGWIAYRMIRGIDEYRLELMISLALASGTYTLASALGMSGPIAVAVAGLLIGNQGRRYAMSETTQSQLDTFWTLINELLNAMLFLLIGFELLVVHFHHATAIAAAAAIPLALLVRGLSVLLATYGLHFRNPVLWPATGMLTWGGLRGGVSIALALSLPASSWRAPLLGVCYGVVVFTVVVQGLTMERVAGWLFPAAREPGR